MSAKLIIAVSAAFLLVVAASFFCFAIGYAIGRKNDRGASGPVIQFSEETRASMKKEIEENNRKSAELERLIEEESKE